MTLKLTVLSAQKDEPGFRSSHVFSTDGGNIGRSLESDWPLPDPQRFVSNHHATVHHDGNDFYIVDQSTNGMFVNGSSVPLGHGNQAALRHGDRLLIGEYEIIAELTDATTNPGTTAPLPASNGADGIDQFGDDAFFISPTSGELGADDLLDGIFADNAPNASKTASQKNGAVDPLAYLGGGEVMAAQPAEASAGFNRTDPDQKGAVDSQYQPPRALPEDWQGQQTTRPTPAPPPPKRTTAYGGSQQSAQACLDALLQGLQLGSMDHMAGDDLPGFFHQVGELLHESIEGLTQGLKDRSAVKQRLRMDNTQFRAANNNPLKFVVDTEEALTRLLDGRRGYLSPKESVALAFRDVREHQMAMFLGMQITFPNVIDHFNPEKLSQRFETQRQANRDAEAAEASASKSDWELFCDYYAELTQNRAQILQRIYETEFSKAYQKKLREWRGQQNNTMSM